MRAGVPARIVNAAERQVEVYGAAADLERPEGNVSGTDDTMRIADVDIALAELFPTTLEGRPLPPRNGRAR